MLAHQIHVMTCANAATDVQSRKRPLRPRKRVLSARTIRKRDQAVDVGSGEVEPQLHENFSRKGGAPRGNTNRLIHGGYTRERRALHAAIRAHIREGRELIAMAKLVLAERAMGIQPPSCGEVDARSEASTSGGGNSIRLAPAPRKMLRIFRPLHKGEVGYRFVSAKYAGLSVPSFVATGSSVG
jgi:hypothetical protein